MDKYQNIIVSPVLTAIFGLGLVLNIGVITLICRNLHLNTLPNYLLLNLFFSDIVFSFNIPLDFIRNTIGDQYCNILHYIQFVHMHVSAFTLILAAIERFSVIARPLRCFCFRNYKFMIYYVLSIWIESILTSIKSIDDSNEQQDCGLVTHSRIRNIVYLVIEFKL